MCDSHQVSSFKRIFKLVILLNKHQEFPLLGTQCIVGRKMSTKSWTAVKGFISFTWTLVLFGTKFQYSRKRRQDEEGKQSGKAAIRQLVLTFCPTMRCGLQRKLKLLMPVIWIFFRPSFSDFLNSARNSYDVIKFCALLRSLNRHLTVPLLSK